MFLHKLKSRILNLVCKQRYGQELWLINSESKGSTNDLRYILKLMCFVVSDFIEVNSNQKVQIILNDNKQEFLDFVNSQKN